MQRTEVDGLLSRDCFQAEVTGGTVFDRTVPFSQRGVSGTGGCMCKWGHIGNISCSLPDSDITQFIEWEELLLALVSGVLSQIS